MNTHDYKNNTIRVRSLDKNLLNNIESLNVSDRKTEENMRSSVSTEAKRRQVLKKTSVPVSTEKRNKLIDMIPSDM